MLSRNEWDPLKSVIVGIADDARIPFLDPSLRMVNYAHETDIKKIPKGSYPQKVIDEANEDLETFCDFLRKEGVEVHRPDKNIIPKYYNFCPRDTVLIHDDLILATPTPLFSRHDEYKAMESVLERYGKITVPDRPDTYALFNVKSIGDKKILAMHELGPAFDAANILRANDELYYLVSNSGNRSGVDYLRGIVPPSIRVYTIDNVYSYVHLDSTLAFLREGLLLANPSRIQSLEQLPEPLRSWDIIWAPEPVDIGYHENLCGASKWINVNLFSVRPDLVVLEENQHNLRIELEKKGIECAMLPMRQARTLGGCFHCVTLDIERIHS